MVGGAQVLEVGQAMATTPADRQDVVALHTIPAAAPNGPIHMLAPAPGSLPDPSLVADVFGVLVGGR